MASHLSRSRSYSIEISSNQQCRRTRGLFLFSLQFSCHGNKFADSDSICSRESIEINVEGPVGLADEARAGRIRRLRREGVHRHGRCANLVHDHVPRPELRVQRRVADEAVRHAVQEREDRPLDGDRHVPG